MAYFTSQHTTILIVREQSAVSSYKILVLSLFLTDHLFTRWESYIKKWTHGPVLPFFFPQELCGTLWVLWRGRLQYWKAKSWPDIPRHCSCICFVLNQVNLTVWKSDLERDRGLCVGQTHLSDSNSQHL